MRRTAPAQDARAGPGRLPRRRFSYGAFLIANLCANTGFPKGIARGQHGRGPEFEDGGGLRKPRLGGVEARPRRPAQFLRRRPCQRPSDAHPRRASRGRDGGFLRHNHVRKHTLRPRRRRRDGAPSGPRPWRRGRRRIRLSTTLRRDVVCAPLRARVRARGVGAGELRARGKGGNGWPLHAQGPLPGGRGGGHRDDVSVPEVFCGGDDDRGTATPSPAPSAGRACGEGRRLLCRGRDAARSPGAAFSLRRFGPRARRLLWALRRRRGVYARPRPRYSRPRVHRHVPRHGLAASQAHALLGKYAARHPLRRAAAGGKTVKGVWTGRRFPSASKPKDASIGGRRAAGAGRALHHTL